jgi:peptide-methionine (S)-S-oxide reductase
MLMRSPTAAFLLLTSLMLAGCRGNGPNPIPPAPTLARTPPGASTTPENPMPDRPGTPQPATPPAAAATTMVATFANGCFWCSEAVLEQLDGVLDVTSGYSGGTLDNPTYDDVCTGTTGHAECVRVTFDPKKITYESLLDWFFRSHDPTSLNQQGADVGTQYRSAIFFHSDAQKAAALAAIAKLQPKYARTIVTELTPAGRFWPAEDYHQDYFKKHPNQGYCRMVIAPKLEKLGLHDAGK